MLTFLSKIPTTFKSSNRFPSNPFLQLSIHTLSAPEIYANNLKIRALVHGGNIKSARKLFDQMSHRDIVTWNTMVAAYWQYNDMNESKRMFDSMPERNVVSWNSMIAGYLENGELDEAFEYFCDMPSRNVASWNAMISGLVKYGWIDEAERLFDEMPKRNVISYTAMVDGFSRKGEIDRARSLFERIPVKNAVSWAAMISGYVENRKFDEARKLFDQMPEKNVIAFTAMITGYCKEGKVEDARSLFERIEYKDLVSWNAMIAGYAHNGHGEEALKLHSKMLELGTKPDHLTLLVVLTACSILASLQHGTLAHAIAVKTRLLSNISLCNALITMYSKCGSIWESDSVFQDIQTPDLVSWNTIIAAYAQHGRYQKALAGFYDLLATGLKPNGITFLSILSACGHVGMVKESLIWFNLMISEYGISPRSEHFSCLVDIMSRSGQLEMACEVIRAMPFEADDSVWGSLLKACRVHMNVGLAEVAARKLVELDSQNSGAYVMLSNIYAAADMWAEVTKVRGLMKERGVQKQPGFSWMEIGEKTHLFMGGDVSHPDINRIHSEVERIDLHMKMSNVIADEKLH